MHKTLITMAVLLLGTTLPAQELDQAAAARADSAAVASPERRQLERRLHEQVLSVVRDRLQLTPEQEGKLSATNERYERARRALAQRERSLRLELRAQLRRADSADQKRVGELLDQTMKAQQERLDLYRKEQNDLAQFLTPVQRAKYMGLQEQMRNRVDDIRRRGSGRGSVSHPEKSRPGGGGSQGGPSRER